MSPCQSLPRVFPERLDMRTDINLLKNSSRFLAYSISDGVRVSALKKDIRSFITASRRYIKETRWALNDI